MVNKFTYDPPYAWVFFFLLACSIARRPCFLALPHIRVQACGNAVVVVARPFKWTLPGDYYRFDLLTLVHQTYWSPDQARGLVSGSV
jgi:hypothetical protein